MKWVKCSDRLPRNGQRILVKNWWGEKYEMVFNFANEHSGRKGLYFFYERVSDYGMGGTAMVEQWKPYTEKRGR